MASLSQVMHEEPQHVAIKQVSVVQAIFIPLSLVLLDHLDPKGTGEGTNNEQEPPTCLRKLMVCSIKSFS